MFRLETDVTSILMKEKIKLAWICIDGGRTKTFGGREQAPFTPQRHLLTISCQELSRHESVVFLKEVFLAHFYF